MARPQLKPPPPQPQILFFQTLPHLPLWNEEAELPVQPWKAEIKDLRGWREIKEPYHDGTVTLMVREVKSPCGITVRCCPFCPFYCATHLERTFRYHLIGHAHFQTSEFPNPPVPLNECIKLYHRSDTHLRMGYLARKGTLLCPTCFYRTAGPDNDLTMRQHLVQNHVQLYIFECNKNQGSKCCYISPYLSTLYE
jgi:hypothetical protein